MKELSIPKRTAGLDVGKRRTQYIIGEGERSGIRVVEASDVATTPEAIREAFGRRERMRVVLEVGLQSPWLSHLLGELGHEVIVANPRKLAMIYGSHKKNDREDARKLMELGHLDPELLSPMRHRTAETQAELAVMRARDAVVATRTALINHVRGACGSGGVTLRSCSSRAFAKKVASEIPKKLHPALLPAVRTIKKLTDTIQGYDREIERLSTKWTDTEYLKQVTGVGPVTSLCFVMTIEDPERFKRSRDVAAFLGLVPRQDESGEQHKQLRITKAGDGMLRKLLVGSAQYILGSFGPDCDLKRWGQKLAERGGRNAKKRAVVAVARRLAVLLHSLWRKKTKYEPLRHAEAEEARSGRRTRTYEISSSSTFKPKPAIENIAAHPQIGGAGGS